MQGGQECLSYDGVGVQRQHDDQVWVLPHCFGKRTENDAEFAQFLLKGGRH